MKRFLCVILSFIMICLIFSGCQSSQKDYPITVTMSKVLKLADLTDRELAYGMMYEAYSKKEQFEFYNCVFKVENNSNLEILDLEIPSKSETNYCIDYYDIGNAWCPYYIGANDTKYIAGVISIKKGISEEERNSVVNQLEKKVKLSLGHIYPDKESEVEEEIIVPFDLSDEEYFNKGVNYEDNWWSSVVK